MTPPAPADEQQSVISRRLLVWVFVAFASGHFLSYALRTVNAALAPYLVSDLQLGAADLGWLSASYFIAFAGLQYPLGIWLDRYGERRVEALLLLIAAAGAVLMALATTFAWITWGRVLIGLGVSACLMAPFAWFRRHFAPQRQAQLGLWLLMAGTSGAATATLPAATLAGWLGWRGVLLVFALLLVVSAALIWWIVPERRRDPAGAAGSPAATGAGAAPAAAASATAATGAATAGNTAAAPHPGSAAATATAAPPVSLLRHPAMLNVMPLAFIGHGGLMALHTLWAGPWMTEVLGLAPGWAASYLFVFTLAMMGAYLAMSFLAPRLQKRGMSLLRIAAWGNGASAAVILLIALLPYPPAWLLWPLLALAFPANSLLQPAMSVMFPRQMAGRVMTLYNLYLFAGAFALQWGIGVAIESLQNLGLATAAAYQLTLGSLGVLFWIALFWWWRHGGLK